MKHLLHSLLGLATAACCLAANPPASPAPDAYPLKTCVVSDEKLGDMGKPFEYVHQAPGQPARKVLFCCEGCVDDFKKDPAKYLKKLDEAAKATPPKKG